MLASPFGETFYFRTALPLSECQRRIDGLEVILGETNYSSLPVSARRWNRFTLWENEFSRPPRLSGKLSTNRGWTEISGRAGANWLSFWSAAGFFLLILFVSVLDAVHDGGSIGLLQTVAIAIIGSAYLYWRSWEDSNAGHLIDQLQALLEAEPLPSATAHSAIR
jgi:hypothetical protein